MSQRKEKGSTSSFSRGTDLWMHQARMFASAIITVLVMSIILGIVAGAGYFWYKTTPAERYAFERYTNASARLMFGMTANKMEINTDKGEVRVSVEQMVELTEQDAEEVVRHATNASKVAGLEILGLVVFLAVYWWAYGASKMKDHQLRGSELVDGETLKRRVEERKEASPYNIAGVPMRVKSETLHTLIAGAQGTGKSQEIFHLLKQIRARGKRAIVYDPSEEFTRAFFREGVDVLMNPLDKRSPNWNPWEEIELDFHYDNLAAGLIPDPAEGDPFWSLAGRAVLVDTLRVLGREGRRTNKDLYNAISMSNLEAMHALLEGTAAASYVDPTTERTGMSLKMTIQNMLNAFRFLPDEGEKFSIRRWIRDDSDSWLFITARESVRDAIKPVLSLWIDVAIKAVLDLEPIHRERLWFFLDELPTLQKLDILKLAVTNTRKYGLCMVIGVQDFSQLYEIYGQRMAQTIISGCQTKLLLRVTDGEAAKLLAQGMGQAEIDEKDETLSYGLQASRDGVSVMARRSVRDLVLGSEILTLPDMTGFLVIPGDYPIAKVKYKYIPIDFIADGYQPRGGIDVGLYAAPAIKPPEPAGAVAVPAVPAPLLDDEDFGWTSPLKAAAKKINVDPNTGEILDPKEADDVSRAIVGEIEANAGKEKTAGGSLADLL